MNAVRRYNYNGGYTRSVSYMSLLHTGGTSEDLFSSTQRSISMISSAMVEEKQEWVGGYNYVYIYACVEIRLHSPRT